MTTQSRELPVDRLSTADATGRRIYLYPADVRGKFRRYRYAASAALVVFFLVLPWLRIQGRQALLLDIVGRRFSIFGLSFWAHDAPMLFFVLGGAALSLTLVTAVWGRVWCGWACPQTVFVDSVFRQIERRIEGDSFARRKLDARPWDFDKVLRKTAKWLLFTLAALVVSHSFLAYFVGTEALEKMIQSSPLESPAAFLVMLGMTSAVLFDFGWFREQFCTLVCPYGRFQSVLMDEGSMAVAYDTQRGEPRRGAPDSSGKTGDCVNCFRCVQVCPTGIDIRRGLQLECIACTACMDACDDIMRKVKKPEGLIRYQKKRGLQPRVWAYAGVLACLAAGLSYTVLSREPIETMLLRGAGGPFQELGTVLVNQFKLELRNQTFDPVVLDLGVAPEDQARGVQLVSPQTHLELAPGGSEAVPVFLRFGRRSLSSGHGRAAIVIRGSAEGKGFESRTEAPLLGPLR